MTQQPDTIPAGIDTTPDVAPHSAESQSPIDRFTGTFRARIEALLAQESLKAETVNGHTVLKAADGEIKAIVTPDQRILRIGAKMIVNTENHAPDLIKDTLVEIDNIDPSQFEEKPIQVKVEKKEPGELRGYMDYTNVKAGDLQET